MSRRRDPKCKHKDRFANRVSSHRDDEPLLTGQGHASVWICHREECLTDARSWVRDISGRAPVVIPALTPAVHGGLW